MPQAIIYIFESREPSARSTSSFPFMYDREEDLVKQIEIHLKAEGVVVVAAFNTYGECLRSAYKSVKQKWKKDENLRSK